LPHHKRQVWRKNIAKRGGKRFPKKVRKSGAPQCSRGRRSKKWVWEKSSKRVFFSPDPHSQRRLRKPKKGQLPEKPGTQSKKLVGSRGRGQGKRRPRIAEKKKGPHLKRSRHVRAAGGRGAEVSLPGKGAAITLGETRGFFATPLLVEKAGGDSPI